MPKYEIHATEPGTIVQPPHPGGILQIIFECYPAHQELGEFASDEEAKAVARELQAKHDAEAMQRVIGTASTGVFGTDLSGRRGWF